MLETKCKTIFWTPCVAHYIDLMLEDIGKQDWIKNTVEHAKSITKYIYNHSWVLNLTRKIIGGKDLVRLAITRFATHVHTLQSALYQAWKNCFRVMNGMDLSGLANKMEKTPKRIFENTFGKKQQRW
jgi:hypothetical protein